MAKAILGKSRAKSVPHAQQQRNEQHPKDAEIARLFAEVRAALPQSRKATAQILEDQGARISQAAAIVRLVIDGPGCDCADSTEALYPVLDILDKAGYAIGEVQLAVRRGLK